MSSLQLLVPFGLPRIQAFHRIVLLGLTRTQVISAPHTLGATDLIFHFSYVLTVELVGLVICIGIISQYIEFGWGGALIIMHVRGGGGGLLIGCLP